MIRHETHAATVVLVGTVGQIARFGHPTRPNLTMKNKRLWTGTSLGDPRADEAQPVREAHPDGEAEIVITVERHDKSSVSDQARTTASRASARAENVGGSHRSVPASTISIQW